MSRRTADGEQGLPGPSAPGARVTLVCTVRSCGEPLALAADSAGCPRGHRFDRARGGYWNLLQPQDRRSAEPGDSRTAAQARRRCFDAGHDAPFLQAVLATLDELLGQTPRPAVLDIGCGEGSVLASLLAEREVEAHGVDLSRPAIELAARRTPSATWVIANADRGLPYADRSFAAVLSLTSRRPVAEMQRVVAQSGWLVVAVPAPNDFLELRAALQGEGRLEDRWVRVASELGGAFDLHSHRRVEWAVRLDQAALRDVLASTYRGARAAERRRLEALEGLEVTMSRELAVFGRLGLAIPQRG